MPLVSIIIGAGANKEINPSIGLGADLIRDIADRVTDRATPGRRYFSDLVEKQFKELTEDVRQRFLEHLEQFRKSADNPSIDAFLNEVETFPEFASLRLQFSLLGRVAIIFHVLGWEGDETKQNIHDEIAGKRRTWLSVLGDWMEENHVLDDEKLWIRTFNYDRILEYYLLHRFNGHRERLWGWMKRCFRHTYGAIGHLPGYDYVETCGFHEIEFGHPNSDMNLIGQIYQNISLISDRNNHVMVNAVMAGMKIIIFGYGLDSLNNRRLGLTELDNLRKPHWGRDNLVFNIYPGVTPTTDFRERRKTVEKIGAIAAGVDIQYKSSLDFLEYALKKPISERVIIRF